MGYFKSIPQQPGSNKNNREYIPTPFIATNESGQSYLFLLQETLCPPGDFIGKRLYDALIIYNFGSGKLIVRYIQTYSHENSQSGRIKLHLKQVRF